MRDNKKKQLESKWGKRLSGNLGTKQQLDDTPYASWSIKQHFSLAECHGFLKTNLANQQIIAELSILFFIST